MSNYTFLFKDNTEDRDCVKYIKLEDLRSKRTDIISKFTVHGSCYCMSLKLEHDYEDVTTILSREEYEALCNYPDSPIDLTNIIQKLESQENEELFSGVVDEEIEYLTEEYGLSEEQVFEIFNEYYLSYRDRSIVGHVFNDTYDLGYEEAWSLGFITNNNSQLENYFNFEKFGEDLLESEQYMELSDGRAVYMMY